MLAADETSLRSASQLNAGTLIWNDPASSDRVFGLRSDHLSLWFLF